MLSKNVNNKKCAKFVFFNEKKIRKIRKIFDIENWLWKSNFVSFWNLVISFDSFYPLSVDKNIHFLTLSPPLHVVIEWPLMMKLKKITVPVCNWHHHPSLWHLAQDKVKSPQIHRSRPLGFLLVFRRNYGEYWILPKRIL